jgi:hypothetical protein
MKILEFETIKLIKELKKKNGESLLIRCDKNILLVRYNNKNTFFQRIFFKNEPENFKFQNETLRESILMQLVNKSGYAIKYTQIIKK